MEFKKFSAAFPSMLIVLAAYCYIGASANDLMKALSGGSDYCIFLWIKLTKATLDLVLIIVGVVITVAVTIFLGIKIKQKLNEMVVQPEIPVVVQTQN